MKTQDIILHCDIIVCHMNNRGSKKKNQCRRPTTQCKRIVVSCTLFFFIFFYDAGKEFKMMVILLIQQIHTTKLCRAGSSTHASVYFLSACIHQAPSLLAPLLPDCLRCEIPTHFGMNQR